MFYYVCTEQYCLILLVAADTSARTVLAAERKACLCHTYHQSPKHTIQLHEMDPSGNPQVIVDSNKSPAIIKGQVQVELS
jgi:hypothetical protein